VTSRKFLAQANPLSFEEIPLFGIPVARATVHETPALKEQYLPEILRRYQSGSYNTQTKFSSDRIHTSYGCKNEEQVMHPMPEAYDRLIRQFVGTNSFHARIWHSVYWSGHEYQDRAHHLPGHISFLHFLNFDPAEHKRPAFYSPAGVTRAHCHQDAVEFALWSEEAKVEFYAGDALVFPSYLEHCILAGDYKNPMVIVSINVSVAGPDRRGTPTEYSYGY